MTVVDSAAKAVGPADLSDRADEWLAAFDSAARGHDGVDDVFADDAWWRDMLALSWDFRTFHGPRAIEGALGELAAAAGFGDLHRSPSSDVRLVDHPIDGRYLQVEFTFGTRVGRGRGLARLREQPDGSWRAWTVLTTLQEITGHEPAVGARRAVRVNDELAPGEDWAAMRERVREFASDEPAVFIVGAGHGGLMVAAHLTMAGIPNLVVDANPRVGDNWRKRYRSLTLHDPIWADHLPFMSFPSSWPVHTPKDKIADWLELYVTALDLNVWTGSAVRGGTYDDAQGSWTVEVGRPDGSMRVLRPHHVVMATGIHGEAKPIDTPGVDVFTGTVVHSNQYVGIEPGTVKRAVIVGAGNSAHDIAEDLHRCGAEVTMIQRSTTYIMSQKHGLETMYGSLFFEGGPEVEDADLVSASIPYRLALQRAVAVTQRIADLDAELLADLTSAGFRLDYGIDGGGAMSKMLSGQPGSYYIDVGCSRLIADGRVAVVHGAAEHLDATGVVLDDGSHLDADLVVFATGYLNMSETARRLFGDEVADRVGPVWGLNDEGEIHGMWRRSGHPGLWFMGGPLWISRFYSRFLALQLVGLETGVAE